jgi:hypothetical protein
MICSRSFVITNEIRNARASRYKSGGILNKWWSGSSYNLVDNLYWIVAMTTTLIADNRSGDMKYWLYYYHFVIYPRWFCVYIRFDQLCNYIHLLLSWHTFSDFKGTGSIRWLHLFNIINERWISLPRYARTPKGQEECKLIRIIYEKCPTW